MASPRFQRLAVRESMQTMFLSMKTRNYKLYFFGQMLSMAGTWMQTVAQSYLVLALTHSGTDLGLAVAARFAPMLIIGPIGGLWADRLNKTHVLYVTQACSGGLAFLLAALDGTHVIEMWMVYVIALMLGFVNVFDNPARQSLIPELVPPAQLSNAVTLNGVTVNLARIFGAAVGGTVVALFGTAMCFFLNGVSFGAVLVSLFMMRAAEMYRAKREPREKGQVRAGFRYIRSTPELLYPLVLIAIVGTLAWEFQVTIPLVAEFTFHRGAGAFGAMTAIMSVGAVIGGMVVALKSKPTARSLGVATIGWGASILLASIAPNMTLELCALVLVGYGSISFNTKAKTTLQLASVPEMRGRVMAIWAIAWQGTTPIGGPLVGWIGQVAGARWSLVAGGLPTLVAGILLFPTLLKIDRRAVARARSSSVADDAEITEDELGQAASAAG